MYNMGWAQFAQFCILLRIMELTTGELSYVQNEKKAAQHIMVITGIHITCLWWAHNCLFFWET